MSWRGLAGCGELGLCFSLSCICSSLCGPGEKSFDFGSLALGALACCLDSRISELRKCPVSHYQLELSDAR